MIRVRVELLSAKTGLYTELARMHIANVGGGIARRYYHGIAFKGRSTTQLNQMTPSHEGDLTGWRSESLHVWNLIHAMLTAMGYNRK